MKVIIIGNDHTNTLGVIRTFGENSINPYLYLISTASKHAVTRSKYVKEYKVFTTEEEAFKELIKDFSKESEKNFLIPTSDKTADYIDKLYDKLSILFYTQNINKKPNQIQKYMNKYQQFLLGKKMGIKMAESIIISEPFEINKVKEKLKFPSIVKPLLSIDGNKNDIRIVKSEKEFLEAIDLYKIKKYSRILIQEFIQFDYECDMSGYSFDNNVSISGFIKKERIWPLNRGSLTFGEVKKYSTFAKELDKIKKVFKEIGYTGMFDIEFFVKGKNIYLNEINFRNSGLTYLYGNCYLCYWYYQSVKNNKFTPAPIIEEEYYIMDEQAEIHQILDRNINIINHYKDKKRSKIFLAKNRLDSLPARLLLMNKFKRNITK